MRSKSYFLAIIIIMVSSCNSHEIEGDKVYYVHWNEASGKHKTLIKGADASTFHELEHSDYGVDKNHVFYKAGILKDADPKTFRSILDYYGKDNRFAYNGGDKIEGADGKTFEVIDGGPYSRDAEDYYFDTIKLNVSDPSSFVILNQESDYGYWAKDTKHYYLSGKKYPLADYETFKNIGNGYAKDSKRVYFSDSVVTGADPATFQTIDYAYGQDKNGTYKAQFKLTVSDTGSFEVLMLGFSKDKNHVYLNDSIVEGADPATFDFIPCAIWEKDNTSYFFHGKLVPYIDYASFQYLDYHYAIDKNHVYYDDQIISGADAKTFVHIEGSQDGRDKNGCYRYGEKVDCKVLLSE